MFFFLFKSNRVFTEIEMHYLITSMDTISTMMDSSTLSNYRLRRTNSDLFLDISGHVHVLILSNLMLLNQLNLIQQFIIEQIGWNNVNKSNKNNINNNGQYGILLMNSDPLGIVCIIFSLLAWTCGRLVSLIWDLILIQTILFYHTTLEKLLSFIWTILCIKYILFTLGNCPLLLHHCTPESNLICSN